MDDHLREPLARAIATTCGGEKAGKRADAMLDKDSGVYLLLGLHQEGRAVYFERPMWNLVAIPFEGAGLGLPTCLTQLRHLTEAENWAREQGQEAWAWTHPRLAWVFDLEEPTPALAADGAD